jgi:hypothetical protein
VRVDAAADLDLIDERTSGPNAADTIPDVANHRVLASNREDGYCCLPGLKKP